MIQLRDVAHPYNNKSKEPKGFMALNTKSLFDQIVNLLPGPFRVFVKSFAVRFDKSPIDSVERLIDFTQTRSSYVGQTALFGYLKARMGTRYRQIFEDETFSRAIQVSAVRSFTSCLSDFTIHAAALVARDANLTPEEASGLACRMFEEGLRRGLSSVDSAIHPNDAMQQFRDRVRDVSWAGAALSLDIFEKSAADLVDSAPVIDEFKDLDREIVMNSVRFRWTNHRAQLAERLDAAAVAADWRTAGAVPPSPRGEAPAVAAEGS